MSISSGQIETIIASIPSIYPALAPGTIRQAQRWGPDFLAWCAKEGLRPTAADTTLIDRYEAAAPQAFMRSRSVVRSQLSKVLRSADAVLPRPRGSGGRYASRLHELPERGRMAVAVRAVLAGARDEHHRRQLRTLLGRFLIWCDDREIRAEECFGGDLTAYRRALQRAGARSTGADVDAAKRLLLELGVLAE